MSHAHLAQFADKAAGDSHKQDLHKIIENPLGECPTEGTAAFYGSGVD